MLDSASGILINLDGSSCKQHLTLIRDESPLLVLQTPPPCSRHEVELAPVETDEEAFVRKSKLFDNALQSLTAGCLVFSLDHFQPTTFSAKISPQVELKTPEKSSSFPTFDSIDKPSQIKKMSYMKQQQDEPLT